MRSIKLTGSDNRMDSRDDPINLLPPKCEVCRFPDLDQIPQPYYLIKSRTLSPNEMALAENGNFFVRDRIKRVLELLVSNQLAFYPTFYKGTPDLTPWHLAVPRHQVKTATVDPSISRCDSCSEPQSAHPGTQYSEWHWNNESDYEVLKSSTWGSSDRGWDKWINRTLFISVRLFSLLKQIKAKGLDEATCGKPIKPNEEELSWVRAQQDLLKEHSIPSYAPGTISDSDTKWFRNYLKEHSTDQVELIDWKSIEKSFKLKLPKSYKDFINKVGLCSFDDVDEQSGFKVHVVPPSEIVVNSYRKGQWLNDEEDLMDGVMFAKTEHGDCFCFDVRKDLKEFEVYLYLHEYNCFELYAPNFVACIKRFEGK